MSFVSFPFLIFFPMVVLAGSLIPRRFHYCFTALISFCFYFLVDAKSLPVLLLSIAAVYTAAILLEKADAGQKKPVVIISVLFQVALLIFFKYLDFLFGIVGIGEAEPILGRIIEPAGLSFYGLEAISYIVDCYKGKCKAERNFLRLSSFLAFFPSVLSGPIERAGHMLPQFRKGPERSFENLRDGLVMMLWGYFLKLVVASRLQTAVDLVYENPADYSGIPVLLAVVFYSFEIYCDFAGYTAIAVGAARALGYDLMQNFNAPYLAGSVAEFWHRWHISLSGFLKDYIYIPLGGNRKGKARKYLNIFIVFAVSGLWHGAALTFVFWGMLHGAFQVLGQVLRPVRDGAADLFKIRRDSFSHRIFKIAVTFALVSFAWIFFRAEDFTKALEIIRNIGLDGMWSFTAEPFYFGMDRPNFILMIVSVLFVVLTDLIKYRGISLRRKVMNAHILVRWPILILFIVVIVILGQWGPGYSGASFIYSGF